MSDDCTMCGGVLIYDGTLGQTQHAHCQNCGMRFHWTETAVFEEHGELVVPEEDDETV